jgi:hypothetical protein
VRRGPHRWLRHPNYLVVEPEVPVLPFAVGAWEIALIFGAANLAVLGRRIRVEEWAPRAAAETRPISAQTSPHASNILKRHPDIAYSYPIIHKLGLEDISFRRNIHFNCWNSKKSTLDPGGGCVRLFGSD